MPTFLLIIFVFQGGFPQPIFLQDYGTGNSAFKSEKKDSYFSEEVK